MPSTSKNNFILEEISNLDATEQTDSDKSDDDNGNSLGEEEPDNVELNSDQHDLDIVLNSYDNKKGFNVDISETDANELYAEAGKEEPEVNNTMTVLPKPHIMLTSEEQLILKAKNDLRINFVLDQFQIQSLLALINNRNVVVVAPCGSGKLLVYHMAVYILRVTLNIPNGVGLCLQPLNNILCEKTNSDPPLKTAYLTMTGEAVLGKVSMSHSLEEIHNGEIPCLLGHAESFLSAKGT